MKKKYIKPVCEVIILETREGIMVLSGGQAPNKPGTGGTSGKEDFWTS